MTRKIIFIIIGALLFLALLAVLWFWFLRDSPAADPGDQGGFGTSTDRTSTTELEPTDTQGDAYAVIEEGGQYDITGGQVLPFGNYRISSGGRTIGDYQLEPAGNKYKIRPLDIGSLGLPSGDYTFTPIDVGAGTTDTQTGTTTETRTPATGGEESDAWVGSGVSAREFTPAQINEINSTQGFSGAPVISRTPQTAGLGTSGLIIGAAAAGCLAQYLAHEGSGLIQANTTDRVSALSNGPYVAVLDFNASAKLNNTKFKSVEECLVKTIAKAAIDQITRSVVSWINSGFNGQPSFVTNFNQYFANVADQAAGEFIKGSALSFLCSPFAPQIKIAIAQSYASRNNAASCSLSKATNNINGFLRGNWNAGGWGGLLQLTTVPTNNPYGAYNYGQSGLQNSVAAARANAASGISAGGFISLQKCETPSGPGNPQKVCKITTPGAIIEDSLKTSLKSPIDGLNLAQNINDIIVALTNQVMVKTLYNGLGNSLSAANPLAPAIDQNASNQAQAMLGQLQAYLTFAGQYATVQQGSIADIQQAQAGLNSAYNCWTTAASSSPSAADAIEATSNANEASAAQVALESRIDGYNNEITRANASLAVVQNFQSQVYFASTPDDVAAATQAVSSAAAQGAFFTQADVTTAQQNRSTLQTELTARNQATEASINSCKTFNGQI